MVLIRKNGLWRVYATRWLGLGLWCRCVSYVRENCVSYARQQISYHMHAKTAYYMHAKNARSIDTPKSIFAYQYHEFSFFFWRNIIRIFMRPGSHTREPQDNKYFKISSKTVKMFHLCFISVITLKKAYTFITFSYTLIKPNIVTMQNL